MLHTLPSPKTTKKSKRIGRGGGSGVGAHTVGRGLKGQTARSGHKSPRPGFEGGQNPISRRLPKYRGSPSGGGRTRAYFTSKIRNMPVKLSDIAMFAKEAKVEEITVSTLVEFGLVQPRYNKDVNVKILFDKEIDSKLNIKGIPASKQAKDAIEKAGGTLE